jgi:hypothetical protein
LQYCCSRPFDGSGDRSGSRYNLDKRDGRDFKDATA